MAFLSGFVKSGLSLLSKDTNGLPFTLGDKVEFYDHPFWSLHQGTKKDDNSSVSMFVFDCARHRDKIQMARNTFKRFRTLRHPDLLTYIDGVETEQAIIFVTEKVDPLSTQLNQDPDLNLTLYGLYKITNAIKFINNDGNMVHGNIRVSNIFVTRAGEWKLGGLELLSSMSEESPMIFTFGGLVPDAQKYAPPEILKSSWSAVKDLPITAVDAYQLGCLIYDVFNRRWDTPDQLLTHQGSIPNNMLKSYRLLVQPSPQNRGDAETFLDQGMRIARNGSGGYFSTDFIHISLFLENISIKDQREKEVFFRKLDATVDSIPSDFATYKILPELVKAFEFGAGGAKALNAILKIGQHMPEEDFDKVLLAPILRMFSSPDRAIRVSLLENLPKFIDHLTDKVVCQQVFPHVATGFTDTIPLVREQTIKAILLLVPKLSDKIINYDLLKYLAKLQVDPEPGIRTNTAICLGKMAKNLNDNTRKKVLIPAFTRGLRDGFHHARIASLMALAATAEYYDPLDWCQRVVPSVAPVLLDKEKSVRTQAFKTMNVFMKRLEDEADRMPDTALESPTTNQPDTTSPTTTASSNPSTPGGVSSMLGGATKGLADWAVSSITRFGTPVGEIEPQMAATPDTKSSLDSSRPSSIADRFAPDASAKAASMDEDGWGNASEDLVQLEDSWEPLDNGHSPQPTKAEPISSLIPSRPSAAISSFGAPMTPASSRPASSGMRLGHAPTPGNNFGQDQDSLATPANHPSPLADHPSPTNPDRKLEMDRKREERRKRMAELREKKKSGIGARKI
ncbi:ARM repeat-containing protein [Hesseltinella vesiculosa]|uniref:ARM repeat-containing protein n=1 Tax=Hesseltinella vesiculosa TaxID=101127 RepID=A0A1X2GCL1_9FUNG|nr:ARM repeat-containing protein [Hesseltinella vesiculosa]